MAIELDADNFKSTIDDNDIVLIDFWASWCNPCMRFAPIFEAAAEKHADVTFAKLDTEAHRDVAAALEISSIPTIMGFRAGLLVYREAGALQARQLDQLVEQMRGLDVDELRAQVADQQ